MTRGGGKTGKKIALRREEHSAREIGHFPNRCPRSRRTFFATKDFFAPANWGRTEVAEQMACILIERRGGVERGVCGYDRGRAGTRGFFHGFPSRAYHWSERIAKKKGVTCGAFSRMFCQKSPATRIDFERFFFCVFVFLCFCVVRSFYNCFGAHTPLRYNSYSPCFVATFISKSDSTGVRQMGHLLLCPRNIRAHAPHMHM